MLDWAHGWSGQREERACWCWHAETDGGGFEAGRDATRRLAPQRGLLDVGLVMNC
jgi:hypothetical protein